MKSLLSGLLITISLFSCQKEKILSIEQTSVSLKSGDNFTINAIGFESYTYASQDEYVAKVSSSGIVSAQKVGKTNIVVKAEDQIVNLSVEVTPAQNFFAEPIREWGITRSQLISRLGTPSSTTDDGVGYISSSSIAPITVYLFDNYGLYISSTLVISSYSSQLGSFMAERYQLLTIDETEYSIYFMNALTLQKASTIIGLDLYNLSYWMAAYIRNDSYTKGMMYITKNDLYKKFEDIVKTLKIY